MRKCVLFLMLCFIGFTGVANATVMGNLFALEEGQCRPFDYLGSRVDACYIEGETYIYHKAEVTPAVAQAAWQARQAAQAAIVQGEVERAHELAVEQAKAETLGRLQQLSAPTVNVSSYSSVSNQIENKLKFSQQIEQSA